MAMKIWILISGLLVAAVFFLAMLFACLYVAGREDERWGWK